MSQFIIPNLQQTISPIIIFMESKSKTYSIIQQGGTGKWNSIEEYLKQPVPITLYIGNLPKTWNEDNIKSYFTVYGPIGKVHIIKKYKKFTGAAYVQFMSMADAEQACEKLKNTVIPGANFPINMKWSDVDQHRFGLLQSDDHKLFIKSLPRQATANTLQQVFSLIGEVEEVHLQEGKWWAFVKFKQRECALRAIKHLNGQTFLHGSKIPIEVRFKEKKYNSEPNTKSIPDPLNIFSTQAAYTECFHNNLHYYYNVATEVSQYQTPPAGSIIYRMDGTHYIQQDLDAINHNDMPTGQRLSGPPGANLFVFHLPNNLKDSDLYNAFKKFGDILSYRVMTKDGKSKGFGFVNFDNAKSASDAIEEMNGHEIQGKKLKVQLKKGAQNNIGTKTVSLRQVDFNPL